MASTRKKTIINSYQNIKYVDCCTLQTHAEKNGVLWAACQVQMMKKDVKDELERKTKGGD